MAHLGSLSNFASWHFRTSVATLLTGFSAVKERQILGIYHLNHTDNIYVV